LQRLPSFMLANPYSAHFNQPGVTSMGKMIRRHFPRAFLPLLLVLPVAAIAAQESEAGAPLPPIADVVDAAQAADPADAGSVLRAQVLLDRLHFSPGEIDGVSGSNVAKAVVGFQRSQDLDATGELDAATWAALEKHAVPTLVDYTLLPADVAGPFVTAPRDMMEKAKLPALGFATAAEALGERFHASPKLLQSLNPGKSLDRAGEVIRVPNIDGAAELPKAAKVVVDKSVLVVMLLDAEGNVFAQFPASAGSRRDPLPIGDWKINGVARNPVFNYNPKLFWDGNPAHGKATLPAGPNNPVGVAWIDLSKPHYGIHGTPEPSRIGKTESHGCIRMTNWSVTLVASAVSPGMVATLRE
jgi:lipoprotein-anchoring transpeptidase ErfK/SrfK